MAEIVCTWISARARKASTEIYRMPIQIIYIYIYAHVQTICAISLRNPMISLHEPSALTTLMFKVDLRAGAAKPHIVYFTQESRSSRQTYYFHTSKLPVPSQSYKSRLPVLRSRSKITLLEPELRKLAPHTWTQKVAMLAEAYFVLCFCTSNGLSGPKL